MPKATPTLADRYDLAVPTVFVSGAQALVRLMLLQSEADRVAGLNTAGYVTGYRGSPLGGVDGQFMAAAALLSPRHIVFQPGLNEELAATALWGTQQAEMRGEGRFDGVFGLWYGKGPGVDRSGDALRHANMAGTSPHGGVLVVAGDDHSGESSTVIHASDVALSDAMIPVLAPAGVQEIVDFGLLGFALSRYAGVWVGLKVVHDTAESSAAIAAAPGRVSPVIPADHHLPLGGVHIRPRDDRVPQEERLHRAKLPAVLAFARANPINRVVWSGGTTPRLGLAAAGKAFLDVRQALDDLSIDEARAEALGLRLFKIGMVWPLEPSAVRNFAAGLATIIVAEEKRALIEPQLRDILYAEDHRPAVIGKRDEQGRELFASHGVLEPLEIALAIAARLADPAVTARAEALRNAARPPRNAGELVQRVPYFCAGCPHNSSTVLPEGSRGYAGIGCHWLAQFVPGRATEGFTQMGGEGATWVGEAPFSKRGHVFQNLGDGTYNHSGLMAIRHAAHSGVNITYKILFNDAVAMTGGQANDGGLSMPQIATQLRSFGLERIAVVSDEPDKYPPNAGFPPRVTFHHRDDLDAVQREMTTVTGASAIIYDQTCAAEKRRRRRRGAFPDPARRVIINELVCEGCGDCGVQSNCVAIVPVETPFGRKRQIDQSQCNKDTACLKGFCPSFVTIEGGRLRKPAAAPRPDLPEADLPEPELPPLDRPWNILVAGIGGTGVVTIGHLLGMAAHIEGKGAALIDMVGISQKNGAVVTHLKIAARPAAIAAVRVAQGSADLLLGCDLMTAASERILACAVASRTVAVVNSHETMPAQFTHARDFDAEGEALALAITGATQRRHMIDATARARELFGDAMAANLFLLGYAWQKGLIPIGRAAIEDAVRQNGVAAEMNIAAFLQGRRAAIEGKASDAVADAPAEPTAQPEMLAEIVNRRAAFLIDYQDAAYAESYQAFVADIAAAEQRATPGQAGLAEAVARNLFKLMAYKDEYEVARLLTGKDFAARIAAQFEGDYRITYHLAPPAWAKPEGQNGRPRKSAYGASFTPLLRMLARLRRLRGTALDPFGRLPERRIEQRLIAEYRQRLSAIAQRLTPANHATAVALARLPEEIRGFGPVKDKAVAAAEAEARRLLAAFDGTTPQVVAIDGSAAR